VSVALLFPGQGTQHPAMLAWLESEPSAVPVLAGMASRLGADWRARLGDVAWSQSNAIAQPLVTGASLATWSALADDLPRVVAVAGYSVGELAACVAAGMLDRDAALSLSQQRAAAMDACAAEGAAAGLLGVSDAEPSDVAAACARWSLEVAIRTGDRRCVIGGELEALEAAAAQLAALGAKTVRLGVRVASHTRAMRGAVPALARALADAPWRAPRFAWVAGITGAVVRDPAEVRRVLAEQVATTVRWDACMDAVAERRPDAVLEVGPGTTLARLWRERHPAVPVRSCDEFASAAQVLEWVVSTSLR
jgi:[acyl-carrier-protein] S-malonyltransferase